MDMIRINSFIHLINTINNNVNKNDFNPFAYLPLIAKETTYLNKIAPANLIIYSVLGLPYSSFLGYNQLSMETLCKSLKINIFDFVEELDHWRNVINPNYVVLEDFLKDTFTLYLAVQVPSTSDFGNYTYDTYKFGNGSYAFEDYLRDQLREKDELHKIELYIAKWGNSDYTSKLQEEEKRRKLIERF